MLTGLPNIEKHLRAMSSEFCINFFIQAIKNDFNLSFAETHISAKMITFDEVTKAVMNGELLKELKDNAIILDLFSDQHDSFDKDVCAYRALSHRERLAQYEQYKVRINHPIYSAKIDNLHTESQYLIFNIVFLTDFYLNLAIDLTATPEEQYQMLSSIQETFRQTCQQSKFVIFQQMPKLNNEVMKELANILNELGMRKLLFVVKELIQVCLSYHMHKCNYRNKYILMHDLKNEVSDKKWDRLKNFYGGNKPLPIEIHDLRLALSELHPHFIQALNGDVNDFNASFIKIGSILNQDRGYFTHTSETNVLFNTYQSLYAQIIAQPLVGADVSVNNMNYQQ